jgi:DNA polymerase V
VQIAFMDSTEKPQRAVIVLAPVEAGFPSPAGDYIETPLDLNELLISRPAATFFVRARGESMIGAGIQNGDLLVVDRSLAVLSGDCVVAVLNGDFTVKRFVRAADGVRLEPANRAYKAIEVTEDGGVEVWGVVCHVIHTCR